MNIESLKKNLQPLDISQSVFRGAEEQAYFRHYSLDFEDRYPGLVHHFGSIQSGEYSLACHYYQCENASGSCFILHGYYDNAGLFIHMIDFCIRRNLSVIIFDLPGHGLSTGEQVSINDFSEYQLVLNDVLEFFEDACVDPWLAIAQSTGGAILMDYLLENPQSIFTKSILLAPLVRPMDWAWVSILTVILKSFIKKVPRRIANSSSNPCFGEFIKNNDPCQSPTISVRWLNALRQWKKRFLARSPVEHAPLVIQGKKDNTVDWLYNMAVIKQKFPKAKIVYLNDARHHLANEREEIRQELYQEMERYIIE